jgi:hypothetical protein
LKTSKLTDSKFAFEYYAREATAGKAFDERLLYDWQSNLLSRLSSGTFVDPDNPGQKPENTNFQKALSISEIDVIKQAVIQNNFFSIAPGENLSESSDVSLVANCTFGYLLFLYAFFLISDEINKTFLEPSRILSNPFNKLLCLLF